MNIVKEEIKNTTSLPLIDEKGIAIQENVNRLIERLPGGFEISSDISQEALLRVSGALYDILHSKDAKVSDIEYLALHLQTAVFSQSEVFAFCVEAYADFINSREPFSDFSIRDVLEFFPEWEKNNNGVNDESPTHNIDQQGKPDLFNIEQWTPAMREWHEVQCNNLTREEVFKVMDAAQIQCLLIKHENSLTPFCSNAYLEALETAELLEKYTSWLRSCPIDTRLLTEKDITFYSMLEYLRRPVTKRGKQSRGNI